MARCCWGLLGGLALGSLLSAPRPFGGYYPSSGYGGNGATQVIVTGESGAGAALAQQVPPTVAADASAQLVAEACGPPAPSLVFISRN